MTSSNHNHLPKAWPLNTGQIKFPLYDSMEIECTCEFLEMTNKMES